MRSSRCRARHVGERARVTKPFDHVTRSHWLPALGQRGWVGRTLFAIVCALICVGTVGCGGSLPRSTPSESPDSRVVRSQAALDQLVGRDDGPGCAAAVAERGVVVWQGSRGLADLESQTAITAETSFRHRLDLKAVHCHWSFASRASRPAFDLRSTLTTCPWDARLGGRCDVGSADASFQWNP